MKVTLVTIAALVASAHGDLIMGPHASMDDDKVGEKVETSVIICVRVHHDH